ncbi:MULTISPECIES: LacI family DNA-binding transcriptional regulator [Bacillus]|jgi:LacI family kdg operon repressor|uniref:LacI family DNA-binding transcriptional regulator n=1 Tax=Bacillus mojavensis TaxID=72360 RepID=A0AAP3CQL5_BACMO|nr:MULTISPECIES: LacI family DNA-binding transcriptional regulator [Bacillus]MCC2928771.1 LacI family DNA-binding transcriptional regulator [Bacillus sp. LBG-1-113]MCY8104381.1 LacI family DNA-binding transcriptional regulator [Bacillus mojavensis]MCY8480555.1 LacI family DNA-binding transcriptional regulator [Bacillus mojavensis]MCY8509567.1 LacI family DNA-binding transcriptional regulator [Bacillus mojavensis]MCY9091395.1 LacI family DNA-binding transcriptional regulator [Bacillus mojavensi
MKKKTTGHITIKDVAEFAGVSKSTVSRYINGKIDAISPEKVKNIKKAIAELNYRPSKMAQGLKIKKSKLIGFVVADITNPFSVAAFRGVEEVCDQYGYSIMVCNTDNSPEKEREMLLKLEAHSVEGLILNATGENKDILYSFAEHQVPTVLIDRKLPDLKLDTVTTDNRRITEEILQQIYSKGYTDVALFTEPIASISPRAERAAVYQEIAAVRNVDGIKRMYEIDVKDKKQLEKALRSFINEMPEQRKAILALNGLIMLKIISCMEEIGLRIPQDTGIAGFDDTEWYKLIGPGITTIAQPSHDMGKTAMERVLKRIEGDEGAPQTIELEAKVIMRKSL